MDFTVNYCRCSSVSPYYNALTRAGFVRSYSSSNGSCSFSNSSRNQNRALASKEEAGEDYVSSQGAYTGPQGSAQKDIQSKTGRRHDRQHCHHAQTPQVRYGED